MLWFGRGGPQGSCVRRSVPNAVASETGLQDWLAGKGSDVISGLIHLVSAHGLLAGGVWWSRSQGTALKGGFGAWPFPWGPFPHLFPVCCEASCSSLLFPSTVLSLPHHSLKAAAPVTMDWSLGSRELQLPFPPWSWRSNSLSVTAQWTHTPIVQLNRLCTICFKLRDFCFYFYFYQSNACTLFKSQVVYKGL